VTTTCSWVRIDALQIGESRAQLRGCEASGPDARTSAQASLPQTQDIGVTVTKGIALRDIITETKHEGSHRSPKNPQWHGRRVTWCARVAVFVGGSSWSAFNLSGVPT
jgi:hypothetical protein